MRLFVNKKSTGLSATTMNKLCKGKAVQLKQIEEDVEADPFDTTESTNFSKADFFSTWGLQCTKRNY